MTKQLVLALALLITSLPSLAQLGGMDKPNNRQILAMGLYPPDLIMRHQQTLGITDAQRKNMLRLVKAFQSDVAELQWNMQSEQQAMRQALGEKVIDAEKTTALVEDVLEMESQFKLAHFKLLIAIKNELSEEQIDMITERVRQQRKKRN